jgi:hypothetical protein
VASHAEEKIVTDQVADRCPGCAAIVRPGSPWCTLCFTDLRPAPLPDPEPVGRHAVAVNPLTTPLALLERSTPADGVVADGDVAAGPGWPCMRCGEQVGIELDVCPACGAGFMEVGVAPAGSGIGLGRFGTTPPDKKTQFLIMVGGAGLICVVILALMFVAGAVL